MTNHVQCSRLPRDTMTGVAEAAAIYGLITGSIDLVKTAIDIYNGVQDKSGIDQRLRLVAEKLPSIEELLRDAQDTKGPKDHVWLDVKPDVERCRKECEALEALFERAFPKPDANKVQRFFKAAAVITSGKRSEAEKILKDIYENLNILSQHHIITNTALLGEISSTLEKMKEERIASSINYTGTGDQMVANDSGTNNKYSMAGENAKMFHGEIGTYHEAPSQTAAGASNNMPSHPPTNQRSA